MPKTQIAGDGMGMGHESVWKKEGPPSAIKLCDAFIVKWCSEWEGYCRRRAKPTFRQSSLVPHPCMMHFPQRNARFLNIVCMEGYSREMF